MYSIYSIIDHCVQSSAPVPTSQPNGDITAHMIAIHGREKKEQEEIDLTARLQAMANIVRKLYVKLSFTVPQISHTMLQSYEIFFNNCKLADKSASIL